MLLFYLSILFSPVINNPPILLARQEGLEPPTCGFGDRCSTN